MPAQPFTPGQIVDGRFRLEAPLGEGGHGVVFRATQLSIGRQVALKLMTRDSAQADRRFAHEVEAARRLSHPNLVTILDAGAAADGCPFVVMELVDGEPLKALIAQSAPLGEALFSDLAVQLCDGLEHAHQRGLVHRDIKPSNVMLARQTGSAAWLVKLIDFGLVRPAEPCADLTQTQGFVGTVRYASPEQITGGTLGSPSDVYSLGLVFYEMLSARFPFEATTGPGLAAAHAGERPRPLAALRTGLPSAVSAIIDRCLSKSPEDRPTVGQLRNTIGSLALQPETSPQPASLPETLVEDRFRLARMKTHRDLGAVYEAVDVRTSGSVELEVHPVPLDPNASRQLLAALDPVLRTSHPGALNVTRLGLWDLRPYLVGESSSGTPLDEHLRSLGPLSIPESLDLGLALAGAFRRMHEVGVLHGALRPATVLVRRRADGALEVQVAGFGLTTGLAGLSTRIRKATNERYASPEDARGEPPTREADVYAWGLVLYEATCGSHPLGATQDRKAMLDQHARGRTLPLLERRREVPLALAGVIHQALAKLPADRPSWLHIESTLTRVRERLKPPEAPAPAAEPIVAIVAAEPVEASRVARPTKPDDTGWQVLIVVLLGVLAWVILKAL